MLAVVIPVHAGIQYAAAFRFNHCRRWNTGSPAFADKHPFINLACKIVPSSEHHSFGKKWNMRTRPELIADS